MVPSGTVESVEETESVSEADIQAAVEAYEASVEASAAKNSLLAKRTRALFREHGLVKIDVVSKNGVIERLDNDAIRNLVEEATKDVIVGSAENDHAPVPMHRDVLTGIILDKYPTKDSDPDAWDALDAETREAWKRANGEIWKTILTGPNDILQRRVAAREEGLMLIKSGDVVFLTGEVKWITADVITPEMDQLELLAAIKGEKLGLYTKQVPAIESAARRAISKSTKQVDKKAKAAFALYSGSANGNESNGSSSENNE